MPKSLQLEVCCKECLFKYLSPYLLSEPLCVMVLEFMAASSQDVPTIDPQTRWTDFAPGMIGTNPHPTGQHWIASYRRDTGCGWPCLFTN